MPLCRQPLASADRAALCADVVARLQRSELCVLPTETVYGLTVLPGNDEAVRAARALKGRGGDRPFTWHVAERDQLARLGAVVPPRVERLIERYWPGPLTLVLANGDGAAVGVRQPAHDFTRAVIAAAGEPLWLTSVDDGEQPPLVDPDEIAARYRDEVALLVDDGPSPLGSPSTVVRATGGRLEVLREGILSATEVLTSAADLLLFVCTGNTCRSPLAEAFARRATGAALGVDPQHVLAAGYAFASAGTGTAPGWPASDGSLAVGGEVGLDLTAHRSRAVDADLCRRARRIYCLTDSHRRALLAEFPDAAERVAMLRPDGLDIADPYGGDLRAYRRARDEIRAAVEARAGDWLTRS